MQERRDVEGNAITNFTLCRPALEMRALHLEGQAAAVGSGKKGDLTADIFLHPGAFPPLTRSACQR